VVIIPLTSMQIYVKNLLDGLVIGNALPNLKAYITPPVVDELDGPRAYVLGARLAGRRQTTPRGPGFKHLGWVMEVYLSYETNPNNDATVDLEFPQVIDAVMTQLWTTTIPTFVDVNGIPSGTATNNASQVLSIGENFELEYPPERLPATLRMLYYTARLGIDVYEAVQI
jgi:hypothetical protein